MTKLQPFSYVKNLHAKVGKININSPKKKLRSFQEPTHFSTMALHSVLKTSARSGFTSCNFSFKLKKKIINQPINHTKIIFTSWHHICWCQFFVIFILHNTKCFNFILSTSWVNVVQMLKFSKFFTIKEKPKLIFCEKKKLQLLDTSYNQNCKIM